MAKIYGLFGSMTGKLADVVMSVRNGEQIARKYQPVVFNPSTPAQIAQRAKLKMLSQLSAVVAPVIAIPRRGSVSSRNLFTKANFPLTSYNDDTATINLRDMKLTSSVVGLPDIDVTTADTGISVAISRNVAGDFDRIVYISVAHQADGALRLGSTAVVNTPGETGRFPYTNFESAGFNGVIYAYGVRLNTETARVTFGNLEAETATQIAHLIVSRSLTENDVTLSETKGVEIPVA